MFFSAVTEQGLPYLTRADRHKYKNMSTDDQFKLKLAQKKSALIELTSNSGRMIIGLFTTIIIGHISDLYGRRIALGILLIGEIFHIGITSLIILFEWNPWFIFIPGIFEAVFGGGLLCIFAIVAAILVDVVQLTNNDDDINNNSNSGIISHEKKKTYDQSYGYYLQYLIVYQV
ncbi:unnamed protein product [Heterobilharzia americana]|nr:unnamed protein product [Heterobilharzia americana]